MTEKMIKVELDHPNRCQALWSDGQSQCTNLSVQAEDGEFGKFCTMHGGDRFLEKKKKEGLRNYYLTKFQAKVMQKADGSNLKRVNEEIGILRMMLEAKLNQCEDLPSLLLSNAMVSDLILKINTLVTSLNKVEKSMGLHLDKAAILQFASEVIEIISAELENDPNAVGRIADRITQVIGRIGGSDE